MSSVENLHSAVVSLTCKIPMINNYGLLGILLENNYYQFTLIQYLSIEFIKNAYED